MNCCDKKLHTRLTKLFNKLRQNTNSVYSTSNCVGSLSVYTEADLLCIKDKWWYHRWCVFLFLFLIKSFAFLCGSFLPASSFWLAPDPIRLQSAVVHSVHIHIHTHTRCSHCLECFCHSMLWHVESLHSQCCVCHCRQSPPACLRHSPPCSRHSLCLGDSH